MKFSFEKFHIWYQYGLSLMSSRKYLKAYSVFIECNRINSKHLNCLLLLAQLALQHLFLIEEAIKWSDLAIELNHENNLKPFILKGCSILTRAHLQKQHNIKLKLYEEALELFRKAHLIDEYDCLALYHLSHTYSMLRQIDQALINVNKALKYKPYDKDCLHLLCLLLTSNKNYDEAYAVISKACYHYEDYEYALNLSL
jgi:tetratricopeptide repeat protein 7